jgi:hypothetical protein
VDELLEFMKKNVQSIEIVSKEEEDPDDEEL